MGRLNIAGVLYVISLFLLVAGIVFDFLTIQRDLLLILVLVVGCAFLVAAVYLAFSGKTYTPSEADEFSMMYNARRAGIIGGLIPLFIGIALIILDYIIFQLSYIRLLYYGMLLTSGIIAIIGGLLAPKNTQ